jgi:hypothetical protein
MKARRIIDGASFDPDVLKVVREAFEDCWRGMSSSFAPDEHEDARVILATAVMAAARADSDNPRPLREAALQAMKRQYPSRFGQTSGGKASER